MAANIEKEILLRVKLEASDLEKQGDILTRRLNETKASVAALNKELKDKKTTEARKSEIISQLESETKITKDLSKQIAANNKEREFQLKLQNAQEGSNDQLRLQLSALTKTYNGLSQEARENTAEGQAMQKVIRSLSDTLKANESAVGDNRRNVGNYKEALEETLAPLLKQKEALVATSQEMKQQRTVVGGFGGSFQGATDGVNNFNASLGETGNSMESIDQQILAVDQSIAELDQEIERVSIGFRRNSEEVKTYENTLEGMTEKLSDLKKLAPTLDLNSEEYKKTNEAIRETQFEIDKAIGKVDEFGNREPKNPAKEGMDDTFEAAGALTSSIGLLTIAFGKSESIQQVQEKTLQAVAIAQTVSNIASAKGAIIGTQKRIVDFLGTLQLKNFTAAAITNAAATNTMSVAQRIYAAVVGKSTGAMKVFKLALAGTGIGALVIILSELIFNFEGVNKILDKVINSVDDFFTRISGGSKILKAVFTALAVVLLGPIAPIILLIKLISDFEGTTKRMQGALMGVLNEIMNLTDGIPILGDAIKFLVGGVQQTIKVFNDLAKSVGLIGKAKIKTDIEGLKNVMASVADETERANNNLQRQIDLLKAQGKSIQEIAKLERQILINNVNSSTAYYRIALKRRQELRDKNQKITDEEQKLFNEVEQKRLDAINALNVFDANIKKEQAAANKEAAQNKEEAADKEKDLLQSLYDFENQLIQDSKDTQIENIKDEQTRELEALKESTEDLKIKLKADLDAIKATTPEEIRVKELVQKDLNARLIDIQTEHEQKAAAIKEKFRIEAAEKLLDREMIDAEKRAAIQREAIEQTEKNEKEKAIKLINVEINLQKELLRIVEANANLNKFITPEEQDSIDAAKLKLNQLENQLQQINENPLQIIPDDFAKQFDEVVKVVTDVMNSFNDAVNATFKNQQNQLEHLTKAQIKGIEQSTLTEKQKAKQIEKINLEAAKKKYQLEVDAFNFNKGFQIAMAVINTSAAIMNALATAAFPVSVVQAAVAAATGAVQIGIIASEQPPPPPFYKGGYTGEGDPRQESRSLGRKSYQYHKGEYVVPNNVLKTEAGSNLVTTLEKMRLGKMSSLGLSGFADGGFTANDIRAGVVNAIATDKLAAQISEAMGKVQIITKVTDINRVNKNLSQNKIAATLR